MQVWTCTETILKEKYGAVSGTSDAAAIVAGIAGMLYTLEPSVENTPTQGVKDSKGEKNLSFGLDGCQ
ncbi:hypothetical protein Pmar_PMAR000077 [Perkinsus marinus ATCC 50983]|uniref:subtilisin n=1 Tax=Perkinsus marinus (strain ATCC 50983 / TXsc) TaxID=423536 RepID=C5KPU3_PERM5|nr:hypothetical protein Pmar_PMAR000077 [Perkinsus marinus ATCC 50983]EER13490.1 hypothetical protein Pmar_PMAR000077 [Perkinsus marinus ATCC 50983]|eukprot:XP_002781695.1 hypothetical protein Pmar_PMAR000077 [Perkinsus marinus ATCC 50983]